MVYCSSATWQHPCLATTESILKRSFKIAERLSILRTFDFDTNPHPSSPSTINIESLNRSLPKDESNPSYTLILEIRTSSSNEQQLESERQKIINHPTA